MSACTAVAVAASSRSGVIGGSCATNVRTSPGCRSIHASPTTPPPLDPNTSTGPSPSAATTSCRSSACRSTDTSPSAASVLRSVPRGSYVTTTRSSIRSTSCPNPDAAMGEPMTTSGGRSAGAAGVRTS
ncbi:Uncharacterised protein [Mycobacteroides abscessus]|nr:Uncharacterised protein [Mycobacteroides abscessus]